MHRQRIHECMHTMGRISFQHPNLLYKKIQVPQPTRMGTAVGRRRGAKAKSSKQMGSKIDKNPKSLAGLQRGRMLRMFTLKNRHFTCSPFLQLKGPVYL